MKALLSAVIKPSINSSTPVSRSTVSCDGGKFSVHALTLV